ncbi:MAG: T9SS type A sorting domain-containing protein [Candidatus Cloacimonetes bacterium]|nr:T9SS type A sorting domain-containing protein [Candidatus Cloacimonadota bacterium]
MKHRIFLVLAFIMLIGLVWSQDYYIELYDSYGDGWDGGLLTVLVNETEVLTDIFLADGSGPETFYFDAQIGDTVEFIYTPQTDYDYEDSYYVYNPDGVEIFSDGLDEQVPLGGIITIQEDDEWLINPYGFPGSNISAIVTLNSDFIPEIKVVVCTESGGFQYNITSGVWEVLLTGQNITAFDIEYNENDIGGWAGLTNGLYHNEDEVAYFENTNITAIAAIKYPYDEMDGVDVTIGTENGAFNHNFEDDSWYEIFPDELGNSHITAIEARYYEDYHNGFIGTDSGLYFGTENFELVAVNEFVGEYITAIACFNYPWVTTINAVVGTTNGLFLQDADTGEWIEELPGEHITALEIGDTNIWVGTDNGLYRTTGNGYIPIGALSGQTITAIGVEHPEDNSPLKVWVSTTSDLYLKIGSTADINESTIIPAKSILQPNYPNPFNPSTSISFSVESIKGAELKIYNIQGQLVKTCGSFAKGNHSVKWFGKDNQNKPVSSGVYFYKLSSYSSQETRKMLLLK